MALPQITIDQYLNLLAQIQTLQNALGALKVAVIYDGNNGTGLLFQGVANLESYVTSMLRAKTQMETIYPELLADVGAPPTA